MRQPYGQILILLFAVLSARGAAAQDQVGVYFDVAGESTQYATSVDGEIVAMYLVIVNPTAVGDIDEYVGTLRFVGDGVGGWQATPVAGCSIAFVPPTVYESCTDPIESSSLVTVLEYSLQVPTPATLIEVYVLLNEVEGPYYSVVGSDDVVRLTPVSGDFDAPVALINSGTVGQDADTWGTMKASYR